MSTADRLLHVAARIAIRVWPPLEAKRRLHALGSLLGPVDLDEAESALGRLRGGSCLSRALATASRIPGSEVVIGTRRTPGLPLRAHAWIEVKGRCIGLTDATTELARLR
jgi:hypothetical protein